MKTIDELFFAQVLIEGPEHVSPECAVEYVHDVINSMSKVEFLHRLSDAFKEYGAQHADKAVQLFDHCG